MPQLQQESGLEQPSLRAARPCSIPAALPLSCSNCRSALPPCRCWQLLRTVWAPMWLRQCRSWTRR